MSVIQKVTMMAKMMLLLLLLLSTAALSPTPPSPGAGIKEADDLQVTTVFTVQPSFHHRHQTNRAL